MTTEPKFIPEESVEINLGGNTTLNVRMIDCVGYIVNSAIGYSEEDEPRMVKTPWSNEAIPFDDAAEIGTKKVITDHSTIGLVITTDGTISDIMALVAAIGLYASVLGYAIHQYGSIDGFLKAYSDMQGMDYNELMKQFMAK